MKTLNLEFTNETIQNMDMILSYHSDVDMDYSDLLMLCVHSYIERYGIKKDG